MKIIRTLGTMRWLAASSILAILITIAPPIPIVQAGTQGGCSINEPIRVRVFENSVGDTSDGNDSLWLCGNFAKADMRNNPTHSPSGYCNNGTPFHVRDDWTDCLDTYSVAIPINTLWRFCAYDDINYGGTVLANVGGTGQFNDGARHSFGTHDHVSSMTMRYLQASC